MSLIFETIHGSHLYGLAHDGSDLDFYKVYDGQGGGLRQSINGDIDVVRGNLQSFIDRAMDGSHQSAEALFSPVKIWGEGMEEKYGAYIEGIRIGGAVVTAKYERTIKKFCYGDFKRRRHACRLRFNLGEIRDFGRFNPRLNGPQIAWINKTAELEGDELRAHLFN